MKHELKNRMRPGYFRAARQAATVIVGLLGVVTVVHAEGVDGLADPTRPAYTSAASAGAAAKPSSPQLQSTFISASHRRAVIGGKSYSVGDKFGGGVITDIQPYEVVMKKADKETRMRLLPKLAKETYVVKVPAGSLEGGKQ